MTYMHLKPQQIDPVDQIRTARSFRPTMVYYLSIDTVPDASGLSTSSLLHSMPELPHKPRRPVSQSTQHHDGLLFFRWPSMVSSISNPGTIPVASRLEQLR